MRLHTFVIDKAYMLSFYILKDVKTELIQLASTTDEELRRWTV